MHLVRKSAVVTSEDKAGATPSLAMQCNGEAVSRFDFLPNGDVVALVGRQKPTGLNGVVLDLVVYRANATTKACELVKNLTNNSGTNSFPMDFTWGRSSLASAGGLVAIPKGGGARTDLMVGSGEIEGSKVTTRTVSGIGQGCSVMPGTIANGLTSALGGLAIVALVARRRHRMRYARA